MKAQFTLFIISILFLLPACNNLQFANPSTTAVVNFQRKFPGIENSSWGKDMEGHYEVHFKVNKKAYQADFGLDGNWLETTNEIQFVELPNQVKQSVIEKFDTNNIGKVKRVDHINKGLFYQIVFKRPNPDALVEIDVNGVLLQEETVGIDW